MAKNFKGKKNSSKGKKPSSAATTKGAETTAAKSKTTGVTASSALLSAAANISFPTTAGYPIDVVTDQSNFTATGNRKVRIPGIIRFGFVAAMGKMKTWTDPFNVWIRAIFAFIRHANSGRANYDAGALGTYFLCYRSCIDFLHWMQRLYGTVMGAYVPQNAYTPAAMVRECGGDYQNLLSKLAELRFYITSFAARLAQLRVPDLRFFSEGAELLDNIYADSDTPKASFYVFDPDAFWAYHVGTTPDDTYLYPKPKPEVMTLEEIKEFGEELLNAVLNSEDFNIMSGDIAKAYTSYAPVKVIDENFTTVPVYNPSFLWTVHHAGWLRKGQVRAHNTIKSWTIRQDLSESANAGCLLFSAPVPAETDEIALDTSEFGRLLYHTQDHFVDLPMDQPDAGTVGYVTKFMLGLELTDTTPGKYMFAVNSCQSEIITSASMRTDPFSLIRTELSQAHIATIMKFDQHPFIITWDAKYNPGTGIPEVNFGPDMLMSDITNITTMAHSVKDNIDMAVMLDKFSDK